MELEVSALKIACFDVAVNTKWMKPKEGMNEVEAFAEELYKAAESRKESIEKKGRNPNIIIRAVFHISSLHAKVAAVDDMAWFMEKLDTLLEIACPKAEKTSEAFFKDIEEGIALARSKYAK